LKIETIIIASPLWPLPLDQRKVIVCEKISKNIFINVIAEKKVKKPKMSESANTAVPSALGRGGLQNLLRHLREIRHRGAGAGRSFDPTTTEKDCSSGWFF